MTPRSPRPAPIQRALGVRRAVPLHGDYDGNVGRLDEPGVWVRHR